MNAPEIVLVGNGVSAGLTNLGSVIESANTVVRFNCFEVAGYEKHVGSRTDIWVCNGSDTVYDHLKKKSEEKYKPGRFLIFTGEVKAAIIRKLYPGVEVDITHPNTPNPGRKFTVTTGFSACVHFLEHYEQIHIVGFDTLRGVACPPQHYWNDTPIKIHNVHRPELEGAWILERISEGRIVKLERVDELELTEEQQRERAKYLEIYSRTVKKGNRVYGASNHGRFAYQHLANMNIRSIADVGCGNGEFCSYMYNTLKVPKVYAIDWASIPLIPKEVQYYQAPAWSLPLLDRSVQFISCFDMMEHLREEDVFPTLHEFKRVAARGVVFSIAYRDSCNRAFDGSTLHPTVKPEEWWISKINKHLGPVTKWNTRKGNYLFAKTD